MAHHPDPVDLTRPPSEQQRRDSQLRRLSRQVVVVSHLYERRPELRGISPASEVVVESVLWSA